MTYIETISFIAAPSVIILFGMILILISLIFTPDRMEYIPPHTSQHTAIIDPDNEDTVIVHRAEYLVFEDFHQYPQMGRRGLESAVRNMRVPTSWRPPVGNVRIALLETQTAEYLFARKPKDQLRTDRTHRVHRALSAA